MKRIYIFFFFLFALGYLQASEWIAAGSENNKAASVELLSSDIQTSNIRFAVEGFTKTPVQTPKGTAFVIELDDASRILKEGAPDLPKLTASVIIPDEGKMEVKVNSSSFVEYSNIEVAPSKGNLTRDINPADVKYKYGRQYEENKFYPGKLAELRQPYILREHRGQTVVVYPYQYNPVTKILRVYTEISVEVSNSSEPGLNEFHRKQALSSVDEEFGKIYTTHFLNSTTERYDPVGEHGNMLIISYGDFIPAVQPLADWRIQTGTPTEIVDVAEIGNDAASIKSYIADYYNNNGLTFVLLVGDAAQVTPSWANGDSDNDYSYVVGNDHYPDLFIGRFSAETIEQVELQVQKTLDYEQNPLTSTDWFTSNIGIASSQGPGDDQEYDYEHIRNIQSDLVGFTYTASAELFDGDQGGNDLPGNPTPQLVADEINDGATVINYTGHGSSYGWGSSNFGSNDINSLTNDNMLPFIWSVACVNGDFVGTTCFAEAWLRAENNGEPTGAVATLMSSINQSWDPPMCGQDEMNDVLVESYTNNIKRTFGGISMSGCMQMNDEYGSNGDDMTDTWLIFGDPALMVRTAMPQLITANYNPTAFVGSTQFSVSSAVEGALAALSKDGEVVATAFVEGGTAVLEFEALNAPGDMLLTITAFNHIPLVDTISVVPPDGPYIVYNEHLLNDAAGNNDGLADYGEEILLSLSIENIGIETAENITVTLSTTDEFIIITDSVENYGDIPAGESMMITDAFAFDVAENIPDGHIFNFEVLADANNEQEWSSGFNETAHAALISHYGFVIDDAAGNNNGRLDPGESAELLLSCTNTGSSAAYNVMGDLSSVSEYISVDSPQVSFETITAGDVVTKAFTVTADPASPDGHIAFFDINYTADMDLSAEAEFQIVIGQKPVLVIDMDEGNSSSAFMEDCFANLGVASDYASSFDAELNVYRSVFVCLGVYTNNYQLTEEEGQILADYLENGGNLYMEGGDTWYYDDPTAVHEMFNIEGIADGSNDLGTIAGVEGSFANGFSFAYEGDNNWIDQIEAIEPAYNLFANEEPAYYTAVAKEGDGYKTIGASFEFGGLADGEFTKDELMQKILEFFEIETFWVGRPENRMEENSGMNIYPNPFNSNITVELSLENSTEVKVQLLDLTGQIVAELEQGMKSEGKHQFRFDVAGLPSGVYFCRMTTSDQVITKKIVKAN